MRTLSRRVRQVWNFLKTLMMMQWLREQLSLAVRSLTALRKRNE